VLGQSHTGEATQESANRWLEGELSRISWLWVSQIKIFTKELLVSDLNLLVTELTRLKVQLENIANAIFCKHKKSKTERISNIAIGKAGFLGTGVGIFATVGAVGTATTGTAIGALNGAAATSATLAWLGGSVVIGTVVVTAVSMVGGFGLMLGAGYLTKKYLTGKTKEYEALSELERKIVDSASALALALQNQMDKNDPAFVPSVYVLQKEALKPLLENIHEYERQLDALPFWQRRKYKAASKKMAQSVLKIGRVLTNNKAAATTGLVMGAIFKLISTPGLEFEGDELLVIEAIRKQFPNVVGDKPIEEVADFIASKYSIFPGNDESFRGLVNSVQGKYLELQIVSNPPSFLEKLQIMLFDRQNEKAVDLMAFDPQTGDSQLFQVKALDADGSMSSLTKHLNENPEIPVLGTTEMAQERADVLDSGFAYEQIREDVVDVANNLNEYADIDIAGPVGFAMLPIIAVAVKNRLSGKQDGRINSEYVKRVLEAVAVSSGMSIAIGLLLG